MILNYCSTLRSQDSIILGLKNNDLQFRDRKMIHLKIQTYFPHQTNNTALSLYLPIELAHLA